MHIPTLIVPPLMQWIDFKETLLQITKTKWAVGPVWGAGLTWFWLEAQNWLGWFHKIWAGLVSGLRFLCHTFDRSAWSHPISHPAVCTVTPTWTSLTLVSRPGPSPLTFCTCRPDRHLMFSSRVLVSNRHKLSVLDVTVKMSALSVYPWLCNEVQLCEATILSFCCFHRTSGSCL